MLFPSSVSATAASSPHRHVRGMKSHCHIQPRVLLNARRSGKQSSDSETIASLTRQAHKILHSDICFGCDVHEVISTSKFEVKFKKGENLQVYIIWKVSLTQRGSFNDIGKRGVSALRNFFYPLFAREGLNFIVTRPDCVRRIRYISARCKRIDAVYTLLMM